MSAIILVLTCFAAWLAYRFYGSWIERRLEIDDNRPTPAVSREDGVDYVPTLPAVVFGHHFSSIAGAGPIVGPIVAAAAFGWGPAWFWVLLGAIFVGGVHDFGATVMSMRYGGRSIIEAFRRLVGEWTGRVFLIFVLFSLVYVVIVFLDLTAQGFVTTPSVATASGWFVLIALIFGRVLGRTSLPRGLEITILVLLTYAGLAVGHYLPAEDFGKTFWMVAILIYCFVAAILPVNLLMQPRDFLSATFLYAIMILGVLGVLLRGQPMELEFFKGFEAVNLGMMVPFLFITVACGACSGFHSMVASGTTSKQLQRETDARKVAYGGMLVEGILAAFAIVCVGVVGGMQGTAVGTFAQGAGLFFSALGIPQELGVEFASLAVSTFLLTTLDTCTRLARFLVEELTGWNGKASRILITLGLALFAAFFALQEFAGPDGKPMAAWQALWPLFGATNQLLAALALVTFIVFLRSRGIQIWFALIPTVIMVVMPTMALVEMTLDSRMSYILRVSAAVQFALGGAIIYMSIRAAGRGTLQQ
jgi:carbon starvation protein